MTDDEELAELQASRSFGLSPVGALITGGAALRLCTDEDGDR